MAFYSIKNTGGIETVFDRAVEFLKHERDMLGAATARRRIYHRTISELAPLSDRDLADIGISRGDIRHIAMEEAMKIG